MRNQYLKPTYLYRAHLAAGKDFLMGAWQFSSNCYVNLIPQWQSVNIGHWYKLEKMIRKAASFVSLSKNYKLYSILQVLVLRYSQTNLLHHPALSHCTV